MKSQRPFGLKVIVPVPLRPGSGIAETTGLATRKSTRTALAEFLMRNQRLSGLDSPNVFPALSLGIGITELVGFSADKSQSRAPAESLVKSQRPFALNAGLPASGLKSEAMAPLEVNFQSRAGLALTEAATSHLSSGLKTSPPTLPKGVGRGSIDLHSHPASPC